METEILLNANFKSEQFAILKSEKMFSFGFSIPASMGGNKDGSTYYEITSERAETKNSSFFNWSTNYKNPGIKQLKWLEDGLLYRSPWIPSETTSPQVAFLIKTRLDLLEEGYLPKNKFLKDISAEQSNYHLVDEERDHINNKEPSFSNQNYEANKDNFIGLLLNNNQKELNDLEVITLCNNCHEILHDEIY